MGTTWIDVACQAGALLMATMLQLLILRGKALSTDLLHALLDKSLRSISCH